MSQKSERAQLTNAWPACGRGGGGRGRGEAGIEAYYSPSMVEDPWRSLRQSQIRHHGAATDRLPPQPEGSLVVPANSAQGTAQEELTVGLVHCASLIATWHPCTIDSQYCKFGNHFLSSRSRGSKLRPSMRDLMQGSHFELAEKRLVVLSKSMNATVQYHAVLGRCECAPLWPPGC